MRKTSTFPLLLILLSIFTIFSQAHAGQFKSTGTVDVYFSPHEGRRYAEFRIKYSQKKWIPCDWTMVDFIQSNKMESFLTGP